jgi:hypothetical protein
MTVLESSEAGWLVLLPEDIMFSEPDSAGNRTAFTNLWIRNRGKSPVTEVNTELVVRTFPIQQIPTFVYEGPRTRYEVGIINPDVSQSDDPNLARANNPPVQMPLLDKLSLPGKTAQPKQISTLEYNWVLAGQEVIVAYAKTSYVDIFKRKHSIHTCRSLPPTREMPHNLDPAINADFIKLDQACLRYNAIEPVHDQY